MKRNGIHARGKVSITEKTVDRNGKEHIKVKTVKRWVVTYADYPLDPKTGVRKRKQRTRTVLGTKQQARDERLELMRSVRRGEYIAPTKLTLVEWMRQWLEKTIKPLRRISTYAIYKSVVERHIAGSHVGNMLLQHLQVADIEQYLASLKLSARSVAGHHAIIRSSLARAVKDHVLMHNVARGSVERPPAAAPSQEAREQCWTEAEARRFLDVAKGAGHQTAAFFSLALGTGARKCELAGLTWADVDLDAARIYIRHQLLPRTTGEEGRPTFGPTKTKSSVRNVEIDANTVSLLRAHKKNQAEIKLKNRQRYVDAGLVFAKEPSDLLTPNAKLGQAMQIDRLCCRDFHRLSEAAGIKRIKFHGLRHTCATLWLQHGAPITEVADRLGHSKPSMTLDVYSHSASAQQVIYAQRVGASLHGSSG